MKHALGISTVRGTVFQIWGSILSNLGAVNWAAFAIFSTAFAMLFLIKDLNARFKKRLPFPVPEQLVVLVLYTGLTAAFKLDVPVVGDVPSGL